MTQLSVLNVLCSLLCSILHPKEIRVCCLSTPQTTISPEILTVLIRTERGGERSRIRPSMVKGLLSTVNVAEEKQRFVPQTSCLQQQGLILALRVNTSVTADPLFTQKDRRAHTPQHPPNRRFCTLLPLPLQK